jgi:hypothetical protein
MFDKKKKFYFTYFRPARLARLLLLVARWLALQRYFWLRDAVEDKTIAVFYCPTAQMPADLLTKALTLTKVKDCCRLLGLGL